MKFEEIPLGAVFEWMGTRYTKVALSMAHEHVTRNGHVFGGDGSHEVTLISLPEKPVEPWRRGAAAGKAEV